MRNGCHDFDVAKRITESKASNPPDRKVLQSDERWTQPPSNVTKVHFELVPASVTSMSFFDRLETFEPPIVKPTGSFAPRLEEFVDGFPVCNLLQELLLCEDSELYGRFSKDEREEFIFRLLEHMVRATISRIFAEVFFLILL